MRMSESVNLVLTPEEMAQALSLRRELLTIIAGQADSPTPCSGLTRGELLKEFDKRLARLTVEKLKILNAVLDSLPDAQNTEVTV